LLLLFLFVWGVPSCRAQQTNKPFTVADDIGIALFGDQNGGQADAVRFSPDGSYFAVHTERGRLDLNRVEDTLRFYRSQDIENLVQLSDNSQRPLPVWTLTLSTDKTGPIFRDWRWLADSSGIAFLQRTSDDNQRLVIADLQRKAIEPLTSAMETIKEFDIGDRNNYVYTVIDPNKWEKMKSESQASAIVGTGRYFWDLFFSHEHDPIKYRLALSGHSALWAVVGGKRFEVKHDGAPLVDFNGLALSPDGQSLVTMLPVPEAPASWEMLYPPPYASSKDRIHTGGPAHQFVRVNLQTGATEALTDAPISNDAGWRSYGSPEWSTDGKKILLPGTFIRSKGAISSRPCVAIVDLSSDARTCVEMLKGHTGPGKNDIEDGYHVVFSVHFARSDTRRIAVNYRDRVDLSYRTTEYQSGADGTWQVFAKLIGIHTLGLHGLDISVKQDFDQPPLLVVIDKEISKIIWDPNPQLKEMELAHESVYAWKDKEGKEWKGGLFRPTNFRPGQRYPLVIQTHGFLEALFTPSGSFPSAFAGRELASAGIAVLQVNDEGFCPMDAPEEGPCAVSGYEAAVQQLVLDGLVDPDKIGILGFSRSCFYVMETLTTGSIHVKAASMEAGVMEDYFQYMIMANPGNEADAMIGAKPFGEGLQVWLKRSPGFNLDKITAPLRIVGEGSANTATMWQPYAGLRYLKKPVDLIMLNTDEHVLTNPAVRMVSQGGSVDWFRFWLQGYEDPDPAKTEQYDRWRILRKLQEENDLHSTAPKPALSN
jgi:dipeptidyl aminopeptidase/acylaminoacyl peptidase